MPTFAEFIFNPAFAPLTAHTTSSFSTLSPRIIPITKMSACIFCKIIKGMDLVQSDK